MRALLLALVLAAPPVWSAPKTPPASEARKIAAALRDKDAASLARLAHPKKGVRFSTYGDVSRSDVRLWPAGLRSAFASSKRWTWGTYDGSGEPMTLTFSGFRDFLWSCDYATTPHLRRNPKAPAESSGNQGGNASATYAKAQVIELYCPGDDTRMWTSMRLAFEQHRGRWYWTGLVHDGWTI